MSFLPGLLAMVGGGLLLGSISMPWYRVTASYRGQTMSIDVSAWHAFHVLDKLLLVAAVAGLVGGLMLLLAASNPGGRVVAARIARFGGATGFCTGAYRLVSPWDYTGSVHNVLGTGLDLSSKHAYGLYVSVAAAALVFAGACIRVTRTARIETRVGPPAQAADPLVPAVTSHAYPAGWYPDPHGPGRERLWDGERWTWDTRAPEAHAPA